MTTFREWYKAQPRGVGVRLVRTLECGSDTITRLARGCTIDSYKLAKRISEATGGAVSVAELCEVPKARKRGAK